MQVNPASSDIPHETSPEFSSLRPVPQIVKDSTIFKLMDYTKSARIDSLWQQKLTNSSLYAKMQTMVLNAPFKTNEKKDYAVSQELPTKTLKERLAKINATTPFNIRYSSSLESVIHHYLKRNKKTMEQLMSLSTYYFPLFEEKLAKYDIPLELKYLAIVESALNPQAKSRVGATGLWQFMYSTGKMHGLHVSSYVDERMDPIRSTEAACEYLASLYEVFGNWDLVLAAYNSGPGNVAKAIRRSGGDTDYWHLRKYLPRETAGYVPAFLATMYVFKYAQQHGFQPYEPEVTYFATDTIHTKKLLKFEDISNVTGISPELLSFLNPSYKLNVIPKVTGRDYYLRLPVKETGVFVANEDVIYNYTEEKHEKETDQLPRYVEADAKIRYRVRRGDYLGKIAQRYGIGVSKIKQWNHLRSSQLHVGQHLTIYPRKSGNTPQVASKKQKNPRSEKLYTVHSGDSLWSISKKFPGVTVQNIKKWNGISGNKLKPGMKLKVSEG